MTMPVKLKDIIKFGRVNFKISALVSKKLTPETMGLEYDGHLNTQYQNNDKVQVSQSSFINVTDMNLMDRDQSTILQINNNKQKPNETYDLKLLKNKQTEDEFKRDGPLVCRICLGEEEE
jgi:hypothetical protein